MISSFGLRSIHFPFRIVLNSTYKNNLNTRNSSTQQAINYEEKQNSNNGYYEEMCKESLTKQDFFNVRKLVTVQKLFDARVYFGHKETTLNPHMKPYIFGSRLSHLIIDLDLTCNLLQEALNFTAHVAFRNGIILFVNKSATTGHLVETAAKNCGEYSHCRDWQIGTFTDSAKFFNSITRLPDLLIFFSTLKNIFETHPAVTESAKMMIPTIGIVDTNSDPCLITYPVPGNDDSIQSIEYYCKVFEEAIMIGKRKRIECLNKPIKNV